MGVITDADTALAQAMVHLKEAIKYLYIFVNPNTNGHDDWNKDFIKKVYKLIIKIQKFI